VRSYPQPGGSEVLGAEWKVEVMLNEGD
jgi:hypothetical protein